MQGWSIGIVRGNQNNLNNQNIQSFLKIRKTRGQACGLPPWDIMHQNLYSYKEIGLERLVFNKCLHSLVACQAKIIVELCCGAVAVFGTLPEQALVVAKEWCALHL